MTRLPSVTLNTTDAKFGFVFAKSDVFNPIGYVPAFVPFAADCPVKMKSAAV